MKHGCGLALALAAFMLALGCSAKGGAAYGEALSADFTPEGPAGLEEGRIPAAARASPNGYFDAAPGGGADGDSAQYAEERKLAKRAELRVRVEDLAEADASITSLMARYGAYSAATEISEDSRSYLIKVPLAAYDAFLAAMSGMGTTLRRSERAEDLTLRYYDLEGRLAAKRELLKTFQSYLAKAQSIEEILSVEARIAELQSEIDWTGGEFRRLGNLTDYADISLDIYGPAGEDVYRGPSLAERLKELFGGFGGFLSTAALVITGAVIYGVPVLLLGAFFFWLFFGRIGLLKKLWRLIAGKHRGGNEGTSR
jgi:hypothetical protein